VSKLTLDNSTLIWCTYCRQWHLMPKRSFTGQVGSYECIDLVSYKTAMSCFQDHGVVYTFGIIAGPTSGYRYSTSGGITVVMGE